MVILVKIIDGGLSFDDVLLIPKKSHLPSRSSVQVHTKLTKNIRLNIPIISANMDCVTEWEMAVTVAKEGGVGIIHRFMSVEDKIKQIEKVKSYKLNEKELNNYPLINFDDKNRLVCGIAIGVKKDPVEIVSKLIDTGVDVFVVDVAHGHLEKVIETIKALKQRFDIELIAGNVATYEGAEELATAGADAIKVGIGPGSACTTRIVTGFGIPQLTAIINCSKVTEKYGTPTIADGGIKNSGDIVKALAAGASCVMLGNLLSGTDESKGDIVQNNGKKFKVYRGMFSFSANEKLKMVENGNKPVDLNPDRMVTEGVEAFVSYKGGASDVIHKLIGGVKHGLSYCGSKSIDELRERAEFIKITSMGMRESHAHDVVFL